MNIVVTGANGYLSNRIAESLRGRNNVSQISVREKLTDDCVPFATDCVVHVAGITPANAKSPEDYEAVNVKKTQELYGICQQRKVKHFIYISSMSVYEGYFNKPFHKDIGKQTPLKPKARMHGANFMPKKQLPIGLTVRCIIRSSAFPAYTMKTKQNILTAFQP